MLKSRIIYIIYFKWPKGNRPLYMNYWQGVTVVRSNEMRDKLNYLFIYCYIHISLKVPFSVYWSEKCFLTYSTDHFGKIYNLTFYIDKALRDVWSAHVCTILGSPLSHGLPGISSICLSEIFQAIRGLELLLFCCSLSLQYMDDHDCSQYLVSFSLRYSFSFYNLSKLGYSKFFLILSHPVSYVLDCSKFYILFLWQKLKVNLVLEKLILLVLVSGWFRLFTRILI